MGLFGRSDQPATPTRQQPEEPRPPQPRGAQPPPEVTLVARSATVKGTVTGSGDLRIEGTVEGKVRIGGRLVVGESGRVKAELHGKAVTVAGTVEGNVTADERIELAPSARLTGDITAPRILIQEGATFEGKVFMRSPGGGAERSGGARRGVSSARRSRDAGTGGGS